MFRRNIGKFWDRWFRVSPETQPAGQPSENMLQVNLSTILASGADRGWLLDEKVSIGIDNGGVLRDADANGRMKER